MSGLILPHPLVVPVPPPNHAQVVFRADDNDLGSKAIQWYTEFPYSHAEVTVDAAHGGTIVAAQTAWEEGQTDPGVQNYPLDYDFWSTRQMIYRTQMHPQMYHDWVEYLFNQVGKPFDHEAFVGIFLHNLSLHEQGAMFCSQLIVMSLVAVKFWHGLGIPDNGVTPQMLFAAVAADPRWVKL